MNRIVAASLATGAAIAALAAIPAEARQGCGHGFHRGYYGRCVPNRGDAVVVREPGVRLVIGNYYHGRGYWDGRRYWWHRYRYNNGWRYR
ncbi:MAG: hypothetical protein JSR79_12050 [Proteobacteria bacterium]|nr:hypothetical protein [Pseudomonadota bacterium]